MKVDKVLIYGSSELTRDTVDLLKDHYDLVGHVPSVNPVLSGTINLPVVDDSVEHDIKLSLQYNRRLQNIENAYNIHTGLLPLWGGTDILYHTLKEPTTEQGITFHKMSNSFDYGAIISKISYPVLQGDDMVSLYDRLHSLFPAFTLASLRLLESLSESSLKCLPAFKPRLFKRGCIESVDIENYRKSLPILKDKYEY